MKEIRPGQGVAVFRLPMPMNGIELINDALHRIYGTGEWMLQFNGDQIQANAPAEGFGPRKGGRKTPVPKVSPDTKTAYLKVRDGVVNMTLEQAEETVILLMETTRKWFELQGGINYVEFDLQGPDGEKQPYVYCVQKRDGATPHAKRREAEQRLEAMTAWFDANAEDLSVEAVLSFNEAMGWIPPDEPEPHNSEEPSGVR